RLQEEQGALGERREALAQQLAALSPAQRDAALARALPLAEQLQQVEASVAALLGEAEAAAAATAGVRREIGQAEAALPQLQQLVGERQADAEAAELLHEQAQREHAAAHLRASLRPGDACPVCAQPVGRLQAAAAPAVASSKTAVQTARDELRAAEKLRD